MTTTDPCDDWSDPVPQKETRADAWARYYAEGKQQSRIAAWEFARRLFRTKYGRNPKPSETRLP